MQIHTNTVDEYLEKVDDPVKKEALIKLRDVMQKNLPDGFDERMSYGMIGYVVPHELYPKGYHCDPKLPLPFINLAAQKNFVAVYHMGIYADPSLLGWFTTEHAKRVPGKLDMGKSCILVGWPTGSEFLVQDLGKSAFQIWCSGLWGNVDRSNCLGDLAF